MSFVAALPALAAAPAQCALGQPDISICAAPRQTATRSASSAARRTFLGTPLASASRSFTCRRHVRSSFNVSASVVTGSGEDDSGAAEIPAGVDVAQLPGESDKDKQAREAIKLRLLRAIAGSDRGRLMSDSDRARVNQIIAELNAANSTAEPVLDARFPGKWRLIYTTKMLADISPFLRLGKTPLMSIGQVIQHVHKMDGRVENEVEVTLWPSTKGRIVTQATCDLLPPSTVEIRIEKSTLSPVSFFAVDTSKLPSLVVPVKELSERVRGYTPVGTNDVTYLDDDLRMTRGDKGDVFVFSKVDQGGAEPFPSS